MVNDSVLTVTHDLVNGSPAQSYAARLPSYGHPGLSPFSADAEQLVRFGLELPGTVSVSVALLSSRQQGCFRLLTTHCGVFLPFTAGNIDSGPRSAPLCCGTFHPRRSLAGFCCEGVFPSEDTHRLLLPAANFSLALTLPGPILRRNVLDTVTAQSQLKNGGFFIFFFSFAKELKKESLQTASVQHA